MKQVVIIVGSDRPPHASGFFLESAKLGARPDAILRIRPERSGSSIQGRLKRTFSILGPRRGKLLLARSLCALIRMQRWSDLKETWRVRKGENSWDVLDPGIDLASHAQQHGIAWHESVALDVGVIEYFTAQGQTVFILYVGGVLHESLLSVPGAEFINAHMGEMPRYRGINVIEWAVLEGHSPKVSVMLLSKAIDAGDVIWEKEIVLSGERTIAQLRRSGFVHCYQAMAEAAFNYSRGSVQRRPQPTEGVRYYYRMHGAVRAMLEQRLRIGGQERLLRDADAEDKSGAAFPNLRAERK